MLKDTFSSLGETTTDFAKRFGCRTSSLARRVGPKRGLIALATIAAAVGTAFVVRHLRARTAEEEPELGIEEEAGGGAPTRKQRRRARRHVTITTSAAPA